MIRGNKTRRGCTTQRPPRRRRAPRAAITTSTRGSMAGVSLLDWFSRDDTRAPSGPRLIHTIDPRTERDSSLRRRLYV